MISSWLRLDEFSWAVIASLRRANEWDCEEISCSRQCSNSISNENCSFFVLLLVFLPDGKRLSESEPYELRRDEFPSVGNCKSSEYFKF